jgi:hypothetical protein
VRDGGSGSRNRVGSRVKLCAGRSEGRGTGDRYWGSLGGGGGLRLTCDAFDGFHEAVLLEKVIISVK